jgi:catechol 2,3-dioxygenase-like lactoylglutathione lyase family enzyme
MDPTVPDLDIDLPGIDQVAIVVEDLKDGMDRYAGILGVEPWRVLRFEPPDLTETTYRGEDVEYGMLLALGEAGDVTIELIEPTMGPNIYDDHLDAHGEGLHHVAYFGWDEEETYKVIEEFEEAGMPVLQSGNFLGTDYWYFDTQEELNGLIFETAVRGNSDGREQLVYPEEEYPGDLGVDAVVAG